MDQREVDVSCPPPDAEDIELPYVPCLMASPAVDWVLCLSY